MLSLAGALETLMSMSGAKSAAIVDSKSGMTLGQAGFGVNIDVAAAGDTEVLNARINTMRALDDTDSIEDILITSSNQYVIIRPLATNRSTFIYLILERSKASLALARIRVADVDSKFEL